MGVEQTHFTVPIILTICFLAFSICSCGAVFIHFLVKKSSLSDTANRLLFCLALSDLIGAVVWFLDILLPGVLCPYSGVLNLWGYQAAQFWTCVIGAYLIITCSAKMPPNEIIFYLIAWGIPSVIQVIMIYLHLYKVHPAPHGCWVQYGNITIAFVTFPQITCSVLNFVFLSTIVYKMRISAKRWGLQSRDRGLFFVMICFMLTSVSAILESIPHGSETIYTIAVCFGALQGFFNSIAMKQKAILQFMGSVTTKFRIAPQKKRPQVRHDYSSLSSPTSSTWLLVDESSPSFSSPSSPAPSSRSITVHQTSPPPAPASCHPALNNSYTDYYNTRTLGRSLGNNNNKKARVSQDESDIMASMENFSLEPASHLSSLPNHNPPPPLPSSHPNPHPHPHPYPNSHPNPRSNHNPNPIFLPNSHPNPPLIPDSNNSKCVN